MICSFVLPSEFHQKMCHDKKACTFMHRDGDDYYYLKVKKSGGVNLRVSTVMYLYVYVCIQLYQEHFRVDDRSRRAFYLQ